MKMDPTTSIGSTRIAAKLPKLLTDPSATTPCRLLAVLSPREGDPIGWPPVAIYGPKVMIANELAGSGGDAFPWFFRREKIGPIVGTRTWGGLVGIARA